MQVNVNGIESKHRIFCNRSMNMKTIQAVGFDMDYTLALYRPEAFEGLAYDETLKKLVGLGYPEEILKWKFDTKYMVRGLAIDKHRGNIIKMDRHRYVKVAYHGFTEMPREQRRALYDAARVTNYEEPDFALIDTLFTLADAYLFAQLVELKDSKPEAVTKSYSEVYKDVRAAIDLCHRDGSIKLKVAQEPWTFIKRDPHLEETLVRLRESGRRVFVVTNSLWDYTQVVMNYLMGNDTTTLNNDWVKYFDVVITGATKPSFFMSNNPLYEVDPTSGYLKNTDGIVSSSQIFQGGNFRQLHEMLGVTSGSEVLYVGDHIYGDILRSKKELGWRTMLVIDELEKEIETLQKNAVEYKNYEEMLQLKDNLDDEIQRVTYTLEVRAKGKKTNASPKEEKELQNQIAQLTDQRTKTREALRRSLRTYHQRFHRVWGELMKTGHQNSRFAAQVENYACLYTSKLANLRFYSPNKSFRSTRDFMPHDFY